MNSWNTDTENMSMLLLDSTTSRLSPVSRSMRSILSVRASHQYSFPSCRHRPQFTPGLCYLPHPTFHPLVLGLVGLSGDPLFKLPSSKSLPSSPLSSELSQSLHSPCPRVLPSLGFHPGREAGCSALCIFSLNGGCSGYKARRTTHQFPGQGQT